MIMCKYDANMLSINDLEKYLSAILGIDIHVFPLGKHERQQLPLYITAAYNTYETSIYEQRICLLCAKELENSTTPEQFAKQMAFVTRQTSLQVAFVFEKMISYNLKRLVQKGVSFIIPGKQLFIPALMMDLRKMPEKLPSTTGLLTPVAQFLLLYHLQKELLNGFTVQQLAGKFAQTYLTISRAVRNLKELGLCNPVGGKEKQLQFTGKGKNLWTKAHDFLQIPAERTIFTNETFEAEQVYVSNINALAHYTMLNDELRRHYAIDKKELQTLNVATSKYGGDNRIEVWRYNPKPLSNNRFVDKLSLYLLLKDDPNERIQGELEQMINEIQWLEE
jgi:DNA-binding MarR family transcriptional regulator